MRATLAFFLLAAVLLVRPSQAATTTPASVNAIQTSVHDARQKTEATILDWLKVTAVPFDSPEPSPAELKPLLDALGTPRVIGLGEMTHGTHEDTAFKASVIRALIERGGIDALAFELNRKTGERLDRFVAPGSTETAPAPAMKDAKVYGVWMTEELATLLDWIRRWNATAVKPVRIVGVDVQAVSADLMDALAALDRLQPEAASRLRGSVAQWLTPESMKRHQIETLQSQDTAKWATALETARELESALQGRDADGYNAAQAARLGLESLEYDVPGKAASGWDVPDEVAARRDIAMASRLLAAIPAGRRGVLWAHDAHISRADASYGLGYTTVGAQLHHVLGAADYRTLTFSARQIDFNAKEVTDTKSAARETPFSVWRYDSRPEDLGAFLARTGRARFWVDLRKLPASEAGVTFRHLTYGRPWFGWRIGKPVDARLPVPVGYGSDILVQFDQMTPSHRLPIDTAKNP